MHRTLSAFLVGIAATVVSAPAAQPSSAALPFGPEPMPICGKGKRVTCVVDGDTIWLGGEKIRIVGYDSPETFGACDHERALAAQATRRLAEILSSTASTIERQDYDRYRRRLAVVRIAGTDLTELMVSEGLARVWTGRKESWCG